MYKAMEIAQYVINYSIKNSRPVSNLKLQKLLYYIQAAFLVNYNGEPCFAENIENWRHGPVVGNVYRKYKKYLNNDIKLEQLGYTVSEFDCNFNLVNKSYAYDETAINSEHKELISKVVRSYFSYDAWKLVDRTHEEDPWNKDSKQDEVIPISSMVKYFNEHKDRVYGDRNAIYIK